MRAVLTCDDVFDVLTREPFPSGGMDDEIVESHLAVCHECRQLAEAFRPAVGLFHEALSAGCDDELPMYRGRLKPIIETPTQADIPPGGKPGHALTLSRTAIAASFVLVGSVAFAMLLALPHAADSIPDPSTVRELEDRDFTLLAALEIPSRCRSTLQHSEGAHMAEFLCCTKCHHATSQLASTNLAISRTSAACAACHDRVLGEALSMVVPGSQAGASLLAYAPIRNL